MKKSKEQMSREKRRFSNKKLMIVSTVLVAIAVSGLLLYRVLLSTPEVKFSLKAAIIDQLGEEFPNSEFNETGIVANFLKDAGFNVSYSRSETVSVTLYKGLAKLAYGIIILRAHSAIREGETIVDFFTSEEFTLNNHVSERENGLLTKGYYPWKPNEFYFAITPEFIENLEGSFPKSIVVAMGCNTLNATCTEMAETFLKKGAKAYIGWTGAVEPSHTDNETIRFLREFLDENRTLHTAVEVTSPDPLFGSVMNYYPSGIGNLTLSDLLMEADVSSNQHIAYSLLTSLHIVNVEILLIPFGSERVLKRVCAELAY